MDLRKMMLENGFQDFSVGCQLRIIPVYLSFFAMIFGADSTSFGDFRPLKSEGITDWSVSTKIAFDAFLHSFQRRLFTPLDLTRVSHLEKHTSIQPRHLRGNGWQFLLDHGQFTGHQGIGSARWPHIL